MKTSFLVLILSVFTAKTLSAQNFQDPKLKTAPIPGKVNTDYQEFGPSLTKDGKTLYFYSKRGGAKYSNLYKSKLIDGKWSEPAELRGLNSEYDDQSPYIDLDEKFIIFSSNRDGSVEFTLPSGQKGVSRDLYYAEFHNGRWSRPFSISEIINADHMEEYPFVHGNYLYFTRYFYGEVKEAKIYRSRFNGKEFLEPEALPSPVNLEGSANFAAVISPDGKYIYYSSDRKGGYGGTDIYRSEIRQDGTYGAAENLGPEINTAGLESYLVINPADGSFIFARKEGEKSYDLYSSLPPEKKPEIKIAQPTVTEPPPKKDGPITKDNLENIPEILKQRKKLSLSAIQFEINSSEILSDSKPFLDKVADYLTSNKELKIRVTGHTDLTGDLDYNKKLSLDRAESVKEYLHTKGVAVGKISIQGKGSSEPIIPDTKIESNRMNRRVEFEIVD